MTDAELIARLRYAANGEHDMTPHGADILQAADRIEALTAKLEELRQALLWCSGSADFNEGGVAREGWLKVCAPLLKGESHD